MRKTGLVAAALMAALPLIATSATAQQPNAPAGRAAPAAPAAAAPAPAAAAPAAPVGGGMRGGANIAGSRGGGNVAVSPGGGVGSGVSIGPGRGYYPQAGWSDPGWRGHRHRHHRHRHFGGPSIFFGSTYAAQPYYYDDYYEEYPTITGGVAASPEDVAYCRKRFRSYDLRSGTYLSKDGNRYPCP